MKVPEELSYTKEHEWVRAMDNEATIGITDFAQSQLGDIIFLELPTRDFINFIKHFQILYSLQSLLFLLYLYSTLSHKISR